MMIKDCVSKTSGFYNVVPMCTRPFVGTETHAIHNNNEKKGE